MLTNLETKQKKECAKKIELDTRLVRNNLRCNFRKYKHLQNFRRRSKVFKVSELAM